MLNQGLICPGTVWYSVVTLILEVVHCAHLFYYVFGGQIDRRLKRRVVEPSVNHTVDV